MDKEAPLRKIRRIAIKNISQSTLGVEHISDIQNE